MSQAEQTFISYSRADGEFALKLARDLRTAGVPIWLDQLDITPGERWDREVEQGLKNCRRMLIILSNASCQSENVQDEIGYAMQQKKLIIPVLHQTCDIPFRLLRLQYIDFTQGYNRGFQQLLPVMKGTDEEVYRATGSFKLPDFNQPPPVEPRQITSRESAPKPTSSFRKGIVIGGGAVVLLLLLLVLWLSSGSTTPEGQAKADKTTIKTAVPPPPAITNIAPQGRVTVSSISSDGNFCQSGERAVDGVIGGFPDKTCNEWAAAGTTDGWIKVFFNQSYQISQVILYDRPNSTDHILSGTLEFSDSTRQKIDALPNDGSAKVISLTPIKPNIEWVKFTIDQVEGNNTGLAEIEILGSPANP